jgi:hypothetical protein
MFVRVSANMGKYTGGEKMEGGNKEVVETWVDFS